MNSGSLGTFVISWAQTEIDGVQSAPMSLLAVGATWRFTGPVVCVDRAQDVLILDGAEGAADMRRRAARTVRRLVGAAVGQSLQGSDAAEFETGQLPEQSFIVTDGMQSYTLTLICVPDTGTNLLMVLGDLPPADQDLWVVRAAVDTTHSGAGAEVAGGVICFTPGTMIATETGARAIDDLQAGDRILTRDNGPQEILWRGHRRMTGARLHVMPHLRPIRFASGALGFGRPDRELLVSPQHRMLIKGQAALALFNTPEVLVAAQDLVNDRTIMADRTLREVTYVHLLLEHHNIVWANGLETESFHPSNTALDTVAEDQRAGLLEILPEIAQNPHAYGDYARRNISGAEAAILRHEMRH
ncbi:MAG: Hint domain-containing protein [Cypionkella sp.]|nr:Hint domain-containing protein [Cypionkella sp.]